MAQDLTHIFPLAIYFLKNMGINYSTLSREHSYFRSYKMLGSWEYRSLRSEVAVCQVE